MRECVLSFTQLLWDLQRLAQLVGEKEALEHKFHEDKQKAVLDKVEELSEFKVQAEKSHLTYKAQADYQVEKLRIELEEATERCRQAEGGKSALQKQVAHWQNMYHSLKEKVEQGKDPGKGDGDVAGKRSGRGRGGGISLLEHAESLGVRPNLRATNSVQPFGER